MPTAAPLPARDEILHRLARIEGQVRGLARMLGEERPCSEVLGQLSAVRAAITGVQDRLLEEHLDGCAERIGSAATPRARRAAVADAVEVLKRAR